MKQTLLAALAVAGLAAASPALAQQDQPRFTGDQIGQIQRKLNQLGFSSGHVDDIWGPETSGAVRNFQHKNGLAASGRLDEGTLRALGLTDITMPAAVAAGTVSGASAPAASTAPAAAASAAAAMPGGTSAPAASPASTAPAANRPAPAAPAAGATPPTAAPGSRDAAAAGGNNNQAVATTGANAPQPAAGANSFTQDEAQGRLTREGYANVSDLAKDDKGVWRGTAARDGKPVRVWLDYKGNIGQE